MCFSLFENFALVGLLYGACQRLNSTKFYLMSTDYLIVKTFNNGSLGSRIDEERSEMR